MTTSILSVRVSETERNLLETAAKYAHTGLSDFVRRKALESAEIEMMGRVVVEISAKHWQDFGMAQYATTSDTRPTTHCGDETCMGISKPRPLTEEDNRAEFDCGRASLNEWFQRHAWKNHKADISRRNIVVIPKQER